MALYGVETRQHDAATAEAATSGGVNASMYRSNSHSWRLSTTISHTTVPQHASRGRDASSPAVSRIRLWRNTASSHRSWMTVMRRKASESSRSLDIVASVCKRATAWR
jgi:hypothetical protein